MSASRTGPLPEGDRNAEFQRLSFTALNHFLRNHLSKLWARDERVDDRGVDLSLEVRIDGAHTNLRSQVQMKSTGSPIFLLDGVLSQQIDVSNFNYLLNGPSPLYIVYIVPRDELRYAWARDERHRIEADNPSWMEQGKVTLHLLRKLDSVAVDEIHQRVSEEGRLTREVHDRLVRSQPLTSGAIHVSVPSLAVTDDSDIVQVLADSGLASVSAGLANDVLALIQKLGPLGQHPPIVRLVAAFAEYRRGRFTFALGHIAELVLSKATLKSADAEFLETIKLACEYQTGRIDRSEYTQRAAHLAQSSSTSLRLHHELERIRTQFIGETDVQRRSALLASLQAVGAEIERDASTPVPAKFQARLIVMWAEESTRRLSLLRKRMEAQARNEIFGHGATTPGWIKASDDETDWEMLVDTMLGEAERMGQPLLIAHSLLLRLESKIEQTLDQFLEACGASSTLVMGPDFRAGVERDAKRAIELFESAELLHYAMLTKMLFADFLEMCDDLSGAQKLAQDVLPDARALGYQDIVAMAESCIGAQSLIQAFARDAAKLAATDQDVLRAAMTDAQIREYAIYLARISKLPADRIPAIERNELALRRAAQERLSWCQHLRILQNKLHEGSPDTWYVKDPDRLCQCDKFGYRTSGRIPDWLVQLHIFKLRFCCFCPSRSPKGNQNDRV